MRKLGSLTVAVLLALAACGGDDDDGGGEAADPDPEPAAPSDATDVPAVADDGTVNACGLVDLSALEDLYGFALVPSLQEDPSRTSRMVERSECSINPDFDDDTRALGVAFTRFDSVANAADFFAGDAEAFEGVPVDGPGDEAILIDGVELEVLTGDVTVSIRFNPEEPPDGDVEALLDELLREALSRLPASG